MDSDGALAFPPHVCFHLYSISSSLQISSSLAGFCQFHPNNGSSPEMEIDWYNCKGYQCKGYVHLKHVIICVQHSEADNCGIIRGGNIHKIITLMEVENQKQVFEAFTALVMIISIQRNEENRRFKHQINSNMVLSMLSSLQDSAGSQGMGLWGISGLQFSLLS